MVPKIGLLQPRLNFSNSFPLVFLTSCISKFPVGVGAGTPKRSSLERAARYAPLGGRFGARLGGPKRPNIAQKPGSYGNFSVCAPARVWRILEPLDPPGSPPEPPGATYTFSRDLSATKYYIIRSLGFRL